MYLNILQPQNYVKRKNSEKFSVGQETVKLTNVRKRDKWLRCKNNDNKRKLEQLHTKVQMIKERTRIKLKEKDRRVPLLY